MQLDSLPAQHDLTVNRYAKLHLTTYFLGELTKIKYNFNSYFGQISWLACIDIWLPVSNVVLCIFQTHGPLSPHTIVILPNTSGMQMLLCYDSK